MESTFKQLWKGRIHARGSYYRSTQQANDASFRLYRASDRLQKTLTAEQKKLFDQYEQAFFALMEDHAYQGFVHGFRLGAKMIGDVYYDKLAVSDLDFLDEEQEDAEE